MRGLARNKGAPGRDPNGVGRRTQSLRRVGSPAAGVLAAAVTVAVLAGCTSAPDGDAAAPGSTDGAAADTSPMALGQAFLDDWVDDGRVVRRDQGDDTVSEGQAYGMLIAVGVGDEESFDAIWRWTQDELVRPDGLMAWRWDDGAVVDDEPASDADLDAARALVLAGDRFGRDDWTQQGDALATTILDDLTVTTAAGRILLPGLWAGSGEPWAYNPSYASPVAFAELGRSTGDARWAELAEGSRAVTAALLAKSPLPSDWAQVHADGSVDQMPGARGGGGDPVQYAYDAARLPIRFAESCSADDTALAAGLSSALGQNDDVAARLDLGGAPQTTDQHPVGYAARAAAHAAAGDSADAEADAQRADALAASAPTYYGAAWAALGSLMLETDALGGCPQLSIGATTTAVDASAAAAGGIQDPQAGPGAGISSAGAAKTADSSKRAAGVTPVRVQIPSIGVDSGLESLTRDATGWIQPPVDFGSAGWYRDGVVPGDTGPAVIAGHIDSAVGPAVFYDLATLTPGTAVVVTLSDGTSATFSVTRQIQVPKESFPTGEVYGPTPDSELRLVTCGGVFDDSYGHYVDNVVVFATRTS